MRVHPGKSKWVEFRCQRARVSPVSFTYNGTSLPRAEECKYMGLWWSATADIWKSHVPQAKMIGMRALYGFQAKCRAAGISTPQARSKLFHTLVAPAFSHGCQLWCVGGSAQALLHPHRYPVENIQLLFLRYMAGVGSSTHIPSLLAEFGHVPMIHRHIKHAAKFWNKMCSADHTSVLYQAWLSDLRLAVINKYPHCWCYQFLNALAKLGFCVSPATLTFDAAVSIRVPLCAIVTRMHSMCRDFLNSNIQGLLKCPRSCSPQHVTIFTYKYWVGMKAARRFGGHHVTCHMPAAHRFLLTRLRLGCSELRVVQGRRGGTARGNRICQVHSSFDSEHEQVEDIRHFLLECPAYDGLRMHPYFKDIFLLCILYFS